LVRKEETKRLLTANPIRLQVFTFQGLGVGDGLGLPAEGDGVAVFSGVIVGVAWGETVGLASVLAATEAEADAPGETEAAGVDEANGVGLAVATGFAFRASFSRTPARRSMLCLAVRKVSSNVTPKKIAPR
jgi:hypothetical protein